MQQPSILSWHSFISQRKILERLWISKVKPVTVKKESIVQRKSTKPDLSLKTTTFCNAPCSSPHEPLLFPLILNTQRKVSEQDFVNNIHLRNLNLERSFISNQCSEDCAQISRHPNMDFYIKNYWDMQHWHNFQVNLKSKFEIKYSDAWICDVVWMKNKKIPTNFCSLLTQEVVERGNI